METMTAPLGIEDDGLTAEEREAAERWQAENAAENKRRGVASGRKERLLAFLVAVTDDDGERMPDRIAAAAAALQFYAQRPLG